MNFVIKEQILKAFIAHLILNGVSPEIIYQSVDNVINLQLGESISANNLIIGAFANQEAERLERSI